MLQGERDGEHDVPLGALEHAVAVGEPALARRSSSDDVAGGPVQRADPADALRDLLAVGADVLDGRGADPAGDAGQGLDAGVAPRRRRSATTWSQSTPRLDLQGVLAERRATASPRVATCSTVPSKPSSATTRLLPPPRTSSGSPRASAVADDVDDLRVGLGVDQAAGRAAQAQRGEVRERDVVCSSTRLGRCRGGQVDDRLGPAEHLRAAVRWR